MNGFLRELRAFEKRRVRLDEVRAAYLRAHPEAADAPDLRRVLRDALRELADDDAVALPEKGWDTSGHPALPRTVTLPREREPAGDNRPQAWVPELAFAANERNPARLRDLRAINAFLIANRGQSLVRVPTNERSLQILGNEKRLDQLRKGALTLYEGRITLEQLACFPVAPPLPHEAPALPAAGRAVLVLENQHSFESFRIWNAGTAAFAAVAYGGGNAFRQAAGNLDDIIARTGGYHALYLGDIDPAGVRILAGVNATREAAGLPRIAPHAALYRWLLDHGPRCRLDTSVDRWRDIDLDGQFGPDLASRIRELWTYGHRVPQEAFGTLQLARGELDLERVA